MHLPKTAALLMLTFGFVACSPEADRGQPAPEAQPEAMETVSILRPDIEVPEAEPTPEPLATLMITIGFPEGGVALDGAAQAALQEALGSPQMALGGAITLRAHTDSQGEDSANLDASEERGLAVASWLIDAGVDADRITVIAMGEQNPIKPNALPDGSANEAGRAANRRVELEIALAPSAALDAKDEAEAEAEAEASIEASD